MQSVKGSLDVAFLTTFSLRCSGVTSSYFCLSSSFSSSSSSRTFQSDEGNKNHISDGNRRHKIHRKGLRGKPNAIFFLLLLLLLILLFSLFLPPLLLLIVP